MNLVDRLLQEKKLSFDKLKPDEREQYLTWTRLLESKDVSIEQVKHYIETEKDKLEIKIADEDEFEYAFFGLIRRPNRKHILMKAQIKNYIFLKAFIGTPEAKRRIVQQQVEQLLANK